VIDLSVLRLLLLTITGWLDRREREALAYLVEENRFTDRPKMARIPSILNCLREGGEKRYEERYGQHLDHYYDEVISHLGQPEALLILGPGEAKLQLKERLSHSKALSRCVVRIETTDKLTDSQIVPRPRLLAPTFRKSFFTMATSRA